MSRLLVPFVVLLFPLVGTPASAQDHHDHDHGEGPLHFSHPLVAESPSPDTKFRLNYGYTHLPAEGQEPEFQQHTVFLETEYAFSPSLSIGADIPYTSNRVGEVTSASRLDNIDVGLKYANFALASQQILLGGGLELGLPTGSESAGIGSNKVFDLEPYLDVGYWNENWELVGFLSLGVPFGNTSESEPDYELGCNLSLLYHATPGFMALLELDGVNVSGGEEDGLSIVNLSPGIKLVPFHNERIQIGISAGVPLTKQREFRERLVAAAFYHF